MTCKCAIWPCVHDGGLNWTPGGNEYEGLNDPMPQETFHEWPTTDEPDPFCGLS